MRLLAHAFGILGIACAAMAVQTTVKPWVLVVGGDTHGYLSPCGCTAPMSGGIRRRATAVEMIRKSGPTILVDTGSLVKDAGRQNELKAETLAQTLARMDAAAIQLTAEDARLGAGTLASITSLAPNRFVTGSVKGVEGVSPFNERGPLLIGAVSPQPTGLAEAVGKAAVSSDDATRSLIAEAAKRKRLPMLMVAGDLAQAKSIAQRFPALRVVTYRSVGDPPSAPVRVGQTILVTPGEHGKKLVRLTLQGEKVGGYAAIDLGPSYGDHADVSRYYTTYLRRVASAKLIERLPRMDSAAFAGTAECGKCHTDALKTWHATAHAGALQTLAKEGHDRDPDCVSCHVVGLDKKGGFRTLADTPQLANVGCESCHGAGADHAASPKGSPMPKVGANACASCHVPDHSPKFNFLTYWEKIKHR